MGCWQGGGGMVGGHANIEDEATVGDGHQGWLADLGPGVCSEVCA